MSRRIMLIEIGNGLTLSGVLPSVALYTDYSARLGAGGGAPPYAYTLLAGALPTGMVLDRGTGMITGSATASGRYLFTVRATDLTGAYVDRSFQLVVITEPLTITGDAPDGQLGTSQSYTYAVTGGVPPYSFSLIGAPAGWSIPDPSDPTVVMDPADSGLLTWTVRVSDAEGDTAEVDDSASFEGEPYWADVVALLHFNDTDGSTNFADVKGNTWTSRAGSPAISTALSKFGGSSLHLPRAALRSSSTGVTTIGNQAMTWDAWLYFSTLNERAFVFDIGDSDNGTNNRRIQFQIETSGALGLYGSAVAGGQSVSGQITAAGVITTGAWHFVEVNVTEKSEAGNSVFRIFVDGVKQLEGVYGRGSFSASGLTIGRGYYTATTYFDGYIDEWRLTVGAVRNTDNYTPPPTPSAEA